MSKIKNGGLDQHGTGPFEQQQLGTASVEWVNRTLSILLAAYQIDYVRVILTLSSPVVSNGYSSKSLQRHTGITHHF